MRLGSITTIVLGVGLAACGQAPSPDVETTAAATPPPRALACGELTTLAVAKTTITSASTVAAGAFQSPAPEFPGFATDYSQLPAFCRVAGSIKPTADSDIRFELWLPEASWNGRFMQTGNGGAAGSIVYGSLADPLTRGYAVANTDTGHQGAAGDFAWAAGNPERIVDYQYRAVHELTVAGKAITEARYGRAPEKSYWNGCSTGGRQGLKEAQRYPDDYDAIIAGAPANNWSALMALSIQVQREITASGITPEKLVLLKEAAIAACDAGDGVQDRVIGAPAQCSFDPAALQCGTAAAGGQCLAPAEVAAVTRIYAGIVDGSGATLFPGTGVGSEPVWAAYASPQFSIGTSYFRNVVTNNPTWDPATFDLERDLAHAEQADGGAAKAMDPDLSTFAARGGKLLLYHGTTDGLIPYRNTVNYYDSVVAALGAERADEHVKLYLVPGMDHCAGGEGAFAIDWLTPMENWVERGAKPGPLPAAHPPIAAFPGAAPSAPFTRPVCVYPMEARYKGAGATTEAASFECVLPEQR